MPPPEPSAVSSFAGFERNARKTKLTLNKQIETNYALKQTLDARNKRSAWQRGSLAESSSVSMTANDSVAVTGIDGEQDLLSENKNLK